MIAIRRASRPALRRPAGSPRRRWDADGPLTGSRSAISTPAHGALTTAWVAGFSSLECEVLSRHRFENIGRAQAVVLDWCYGFYNHDRRHSTIGMVSPITYEKTAAPDRDAA